jgi:hypothetical protein
MWNTAQQRAVRPTTLEGQNSHASQPVSKNYAEGAPTTAVDKSRTSEGLAIDATKIIDKMSPNQALTDSLSHSRGDARRQASDISQALSLDRVHLLRRYLYV